jgi:hypothetical protein
MLTVTLVGESAHVKPVEGETDDVRETVPVKPWSPVIVIVEAPGAPASMDKFVGLAATVKSWTVKVRDAA